MNGNGKAGLTEKQLRLIPFLLGAPSMEEACKQAKISKATVYGWLKEEAFREEVAKTAPIPAHYIERSIDGAASRHTVIDNCDNVSVLVSR